MKKRIVGLVVLFILLLSCGFNSEEQKVYDSADLFTEAQESTLQSKCIKIAKAKKVDISIVTTNNTEGMTSEKYADYFYLHHNFGYEKENGTGMLLLIDMQNREIWIATSGEAIRYFTDKRIQSIVEEITPDMSQGNYVNGAELYLKDVEQYMGVSANPLIRAVKNVFVQLLAALFLGGMALLIMLSGQRSKVTINDRTYLKDHQIQIHNQQDLYIRTTTVTRKIETNKGGGSTTHSTGGNTFGGGGGKF